MIDDISHIWIDLAGNKISFCNETTNDSHHQPLMTIKLLKEVLEKASAYNYKISILATAGSTPAPFIDLCKTFKATIFMAACAPYVESYTNCIFVIDMANNHWPIVAASTNEVIIRVRRNRLGDLFKTVSTLWRSPKRISLRHPELLTYNKQDLCVYRDQLVAIGEYLLDKRNTGNGACVDCLTEPVMGKSTGECGAGISSIAVSRDGQVYPCPAFQEYEQYASGDFLEDYHIPNRRLFRRDHSRPCTKCTTLDCRRCLYLSKKATQEVCVPPRAMCYLSLYELEAQVWFAKELRRKGLWKSTYMGPIMPAVRDPYEIIVAEDNHVADLGWRYLMKCDKQHLDSVSMLSITHGLQAWLESLNLCLEAKVVPTRQLLETDILSCLRKSIIEHYRDISFSESYPTISEIEILLREAASKIIDTV